MASFNRVILIGNLGRDPELRYTGSGTAVSNVSLATTDRVKNKQSPGEYEDHTEWHELVFWDKLAEIVCEHLKKGKSVFVEGRLQTRKWQDKSGNDRYNTEIHVEKMQMLGGKEKEGHDE